MNLKKLNTVDAVEEVCNLDSTYCAYCDGRFKKMGEHPEEHLPIIQITQDIGPSFFLHRNCVIAFYTRIQNEFEKL